MSSSPPSSTSELTPNANQKIIQYLNDALAMENASEERIRTRLRETIVDDTRAQLQDHLDETRNQKDRLKQIITNHGGEPTDAKAELPSLKPNTIDLVRNDDDMMTSSSTGLTADKKGSEDLRHDPSVKSIMKETDNVRLAAERELLQTERDAIIENAEIVKYKILLEIAKRTGATDAVPVIDQNLKEEMQIANWIIANTPNLLRRLWAQIEVSAGARSVPEV